MNEYGSKIIVLILAGLTHRFGVANTWWGVVRCRHIVPIQSGAYPPTQILNFLRTAEAVEALTDNHSVFGLRLHQEEIELS